MLCCNSRVLNVSQFNKVFPNVIDMFSEVGLYASKILNYPFKTGLHLLKVIFEVFALITAGCFL